VSAVADSGTGDIILKLVNAAAPPRPLRIVFSGSEVLGSIAHSSVLTGAADAVNGLDEAQALVPVAGVVPVGPSVDYAAPANSLTILRLRPQPVPAYAQSR
jgi:alpha-L-arabinofuranosidase